MKVNIFCQKFRRRHSLLGAGNNMNFKLGNKRKTLKNSGWGGSKIWLVEIILAAVFAVIRR